MLQLKVILLLTALYATGFVVVRQLLKPQARSWLDWRLLAALPCAAAGLFGANVWIYYGVVLVVMLALPRSRMEAVGLYFALVLMLPYVGFAFRTGSTLILDLTTNHVAALGLLGALRFRSARLPRTDGRWAVAIVILLVALVQTIIAARITPTSATTVLREALSTAIVIGIPFYILSTAIHRDRDLRQPVFYLVAIGAILSVQATFEMLRHWPLDQSIDARLGTLSGLSRTLSVRGGLMRAPGPFSESTAFGFFLALAAIGAAAMPSLFRSRPLWLAAIALCMIGQIATLSRNCLVGTAIGLVAIGIYRGQIGRSLGVALTVAAGAGALLLSAPEDSLIGSMLGKAGHAELTAEYRSTLFRETVPLIRQSPVTGTPVDRLREYLRPKLRSNKLSVDWVNAYLYFAATTGIPGLLIFIALMFYPAWLLAARRRQLRASTTGGDEAAAALFAGQIAIAAMLIGTSFAERLPMLSIAMAALTSLTLAFGRQRRAGGAREDRPARAPMMVIDPRRPAMNQPR